MARALSEPVRVDPKTLPVFVWCCTEGDDLLRLTFNWIDKEVAKGHEAYIWVTDERRSNNGPVYLYGHPERPVAPNWETFVESEGLDPAIPRESTQFVVRR
jgi:hypothetical protein